jgi:predicted ArsR family transcriptional regulator
MKILKMLMQMGELNVSEIARRLRVNYETTNGHLKVLEGEGLLLHKMFGRIRLYRLNEASPRTRALQNLVESWEACQESKEKRDSAH